MKRKYILWALFFLVSFSAGAQDSFFKPFTSFRVIPTEHFDIIFPKESEPSARLLASYADRVYGEVSALLGIEVPGRIPVTFSPHTDMFNGVYWGLPAPHIVLYDTPSDPEWTSFADNLEGLFRHELTHAVSFSARGPFFRGLERVFGNWVYPVMLNAPPFMQEGVTVSFESLSGFGRANDPLVKQKLRQAVHEGKFLTPFQASNVYDLPGQESMYYEYGGLFSTWLQKTRGMEKYAELWQAMGRGFYFSFFAYRSGFYHIFKKVYGVDFLDAWNAFAASLDPGELENNSNEVIEEKYRFFSESESFIPGIKARGSDLYFLDESENKVRVYNTRTGKERSIIDNAGTSYDFDVAGDGGTLLLSGYRYVDGRASAVAAEYDAASGRKTGRTTRGLYKARYFRNGVIGIRSELHNNSVVYEEFAGTGGGANAGGREILFSGNERLQFSGPQAVDDERIVCIAVRDGKRELWLYHYSSRELFKIEISSEASNGISSGGENEYWRYMRDLGVSDGKIFFSHNADDRMYKLARIDPDAMRAVFSERNFSGGVFNPVAVDDSVYYRGAFFSRDRILRFPETTASLSGKKYDLKLSALDNLTYETVLKNAEGDGRDQQPVEPAGFNSGSNPKAPKRYNALRYINPFQCWIPLPLIRGSDDDFFDISLDGGGILSLIGEPTRRNSVTIEAYADIRYQMARIAQFSWQNTAMGFPLALDFFDTVEETGNDPYRRRATGGSLTGSSWFNTGQWSASFFLRGGYTRIADFDGGESAYSWKGTKNYFYLSAGSALSNLVRREHELFGRGVAVELSGISHANVFLPRIDGIFQASAENRFPLRLTLFASYDAGGMDIHGVSNNYTGTLIPAAALREYTHPPGLDLAWLGGGELALGLFSFEIQKNLSHMYFNRFFGILAARNEIYDGNGNPDAPGIAINDFRLAQSLMLSLGMKMTVLPVVKIPVFLEPYVSGYWKFSNTVTGNGNPFYLALGVNLSY